VVVVEIHTVVDSPGIGVTSSHDLWLLGGEVSMDPLSLRSAAERELCSGGRFKS
jgi:hypothetical protein